MTQESQPDPQPAPEPGRAKFRRRPPTSAAERERRERFGKEWGSRISEFWKQQHAREARAKETSR